MADFENARAPHDKTDDVARSSGKPKSGMSLSMHDGVDASCDCCSCEAEPYWLEAMAERPLPADRG